MYSKNDYRYYLEHQLMDSDDFLAHYGVKGMKWHKHIKGEIDNIKYDLNQRQIGQIAKGNTVYDPVKGTYKNSRASKKKHPGESSFTSNYRDSISGDYKIKRRTRKSKLFQAIGKVSGAKDTSKVEYKATGEQAKKKMIRQREKNGVVNLTNNTYYHGEKSKARKMNKLYQSHDPRSVGKRKTDELMKAKKMTPNAKTGVDRSSDGLYIVSTSKKNKNRSVPKNQEVEVTHRSTPSTKKSKNSSNYHKEYDPNTGKVKYKKKTKSEKELENYAREAAIELNKKKKR